MNLRLITLLAIASFAVTLTATAQPDFDAIVMDPQGLPVVIEDSCTACGDCVDICPKDLFSLQEADNRLWVRCRNEEFGDGVLTACEVGSGRCT